MQYSDNSKGMIINQNDELFSYDLNVDNFTFVKKKYNFSKILNKLVEIINNYYYDKYEDGYDALEKYLQLCLLSVSGTTIEIFNFGELSLNNNIIILEYICFTGNKFHEIDINDFIIDETFIQLNI